MRKMKWVGLFLFMGLISSSCKKDLISSDNLYIPTSADATATATLDDLTQGRTMYINNCESCHSLYSPDSYTASRWKTIMPGMGSKTGMTSAQILLATKYVTRGQ